jgi:hypothetical protein
LEQEDESIKYKEMARTVAEIKGIITQRVTSDPVLKESISSTSSVALWNLYAWIVAYCIWTLEVIFDLHQEKVDTDLLQEKAHRPSWYRQKMLDFRFGYNLIAETDKYDDTGLTEDDILNSKIVTYCAVTEAEEDSRLIIKVATESGGILTPLTVIQENALKNYIARYRDAGVATTLINYLPDKLFLTMRIFYDPLVLDSNGMHLIKGSFPVEEGIEAFLKQLPFNGELALFNLVDYLQQVEGVKIPHIDYAASSWINPSLGGYDIAQPIDIRNIPKSGYYEVVDYTGITYEPYV